MTSTADIQLLLIEDNPADAFLLQYMLQHIEGQNFSVQHVTRLKEAQQQFEAGYQADIVLLDLSLPDSQGMETVTAIIDIAPHTPIIVMTGNQDPSAVQEAVKIGAQDFLIKGENDARFLDKTIRYAIERKSAESRLTYLAHYDSLTGLANRALFDDNLRQALARSRRKESLLGLLFIDLDRFKMINDTLGHDAGDELLRNVAQRIKNVIREGDFAARLGGDEFTVIVEGIAAISNAGIVAQKILQAMSAPFTLNGQQVAVSSSIGVATYPTAGNSAEELIKNADIAMYRAKNRGRNNYQIYSDDLTPNERHRLQTEHELHRALKQNELQLHYQPIIETQTGAILGAEALLRWRRNGHQELIPPLEFIPILEKTGLIVSVGKWVLRNACLQCKTWHDAGAENLRITVNLSPQQLRGPDTLQWIQDALNESQLAAQFLELEISSRIFTHPSSTEKESLDSIRAMGVGLCIDDFGYGDTSLSCLMSNQLNSVKIDRRFLQGVTTHKPTNVVIAAIIQMAQNLGLQVIAEGVENRAQLSFLQAHGCAQSQGYLFSPPIEAQKFARLLHEKRKQTTLA
ncbi:MAG: EAL domain-containing protein [Gammaproteobacteria bacterium]|nr:EAL domain-containing protein [Gammaproteobacteria bacterium]